MMMIFFQNLIIRYITSTISYLDVGLGKEEHFVPKGMELGQTFVLD